MDIPGLVLVFAGGKGDEEHGPSGEDQFTGDDGSQKPCGRLRKGCNDDDTEAEGDDTVENQPSFTRNFADAHAGEQAEDSSEYEEPADNQSERAGGLLVLPGVPSVQADTLASILTEDAV